MRSSSAQWMVNDVFEHTLSFLNVSDLMRCQGVNHEWNQRARTERLWYALPLVVQTFGPPTRAAHMASLAFMRACLRDTQKADKKVNLLSQFAGISFFPNEGNFPLEQHAPAIRVALQKTHIAHLMLQQVIFAAWSTLWIVLWCTANAPTQFVYVVLGMSNIFPGIYYGAMRVVYVYVANPFVNVDGGLDPVSWMQSLDALYQSTRWQPFRPVQELARSINLELVLSMISIVYARETKMPLWLCHLAVLFLLFYVDSIQHRLLKCFYASGLATSHDMDRARYYPRLGLWLFLIPQCVVPTLIMWVGDLSYLTCLACLAWWLGLACIRAIEHENDRASLQASALVLRTLVK
jgi:hypothetical protein